MQLTTAHERLMQHLLTRVTDKEVREFQTTCRWIASRGGFWNLDAWLMAREDLGLFEEESEKVRQFRLRLESLIAKREWEAVSEKKKHSSINSLSSEQRRRMILQRRQDLDDQRSALYSHVPRPGAELPLHVRMAIAFNKRQREAS